MSDKYKCEVCGGSGKSSVPAKNDVFIWTCEPCQGTGKKQITISQEAYDRLKMAGRQRDKALEILDTVIDNSCNCPKDFELPTSPCRGTPVDCPGCFKQAILSYGKEGDE